MPHNIDHEVFSFCIIEVYKGKEGIVMKTVSMYRKLWNIFIKYDRKKTVLFLIILFSFSIISFVQPIISGKIVFFLQNGSRFVNCLALFVTNLIFPAVANALSSYNSELLTSIVQTDMQTEILSSLIYKRNLLSGKTKGEIITALRTDTSIILNLGKLMLSFSANVLSAIIAALGLLIYSPFIFLLSVLISPLIYLLNCSLNKKISDYSQNKYKLASNYKNVINDIVFSYEEMRFLNSYDKVIDNVRDEQQKIMKNDIECDVRIDSPGRVLDLINGITPIIGYIVGLLLFSSDYRQLSLIIISTSYMTNFWSKISFVAFIRVLSAPLMNSLIRVEEITKDNIEPSNQLIIEDDKSILNFDLLLVKDLTFSYENSLQVFSNFSVEFPSTGFIVLTGASGSGKSTLLKLLLKEYENNNVFVDKTPLSDISLPFWQKHVGYVAQSSHLFSGSVCDNIELYNPNYDKEYICHLAEKLNIIAELGNDFLDFELHEDNIGLSGGQKDRLILLCVLSRKPRILLLDEPTNGLDEKSVSNIIDILVSLKNDMLIICASHDKYLIERCDKILNFGEKTINI